MTQEEILEYNKRCAEFLTINEELKNELSAYPLQEYSYLCSYANSAFICDREDNPSNTVWDYLKFHSDWNWIMKVVEAIEKLGFYSKISGCASSICHYCWFDEGGDGGDMPENRTVIGYNGKNKESKKEVVVQAINQFLLWYNEHNSKFPNS